MCIDIRSVTSSVCVCACVCADIERAVYDNPIRRLSTRRMPIKPCVCTASDVAPTTPYSAAQTPVVGVVCLAHWLSHHK